MSASYRQISLPADLCASIEARFGDLETFLEFLIREALRDNAALLDQNEQRILEERLRDLGYI